MKKIIIVIALAIFVQGLNGQMQEAVERVAKEYGLMGLSVVAVCNGEIAGDWYTGLRDSDRNLPVDENTKYRIASISKFVMTTAMMKLNDQKRIDLDADAGDYRVSGSGTRITRKPDNGQDAAASQRVTE
jgi:CubicO group peptidase (beta-lactamase class C family)